MDAQAVAFAIVAVVALVSGIGVVTTRNVAHAALFLLVSLASVAGVFILLVAEFLALVQVLIYGGAVTIVLLFALMLTRAEEFSNVRANPQWLVGALAALGVFGAMGAVILNDRLDTQALQGPSLQELGGELFTNWVVPFEIASLVLLMALIGAIILARASDNDAPGSGG
ncbi:MAG: NADH-quinone oxidoreductase subunit J [Chloroflexi bacterium]|nr:NADH-quinone oxidoreductase subunit J [Chloroflexota bacterium]